MQKNFVHSCDQVVSERYFRENTVVTEVVLIQLFSYRWLWTKSKNENIEYHGILTSFKNQLYSKQRSSIFLLLSSWSLAVYLHVRVKLKFFENFSLIILVVAQRLQENGNEFRVLFLLSPKKAFLLLHTVLKLFHFQQAP